MGEALLRSESSGKVIRQCISQRDDVFSIKGSGLVLVFSSLILTCFLRTSPIALQKSPLNLVFLEKKNTKTCLQQFPESAPNFFMVLKTLSFIATNEGVF
jgi:hypothetical protein